ncbi:MAG: aminotransferase class I/II-fold pyridoxal phosphate-dependent enzyme [Eubacteriales bacterium]|nr:aminotransferase class I/II-fold pyridoxal phosphate-dependent enzyme [Eubacteriales bacterium]
MEIILKKLDELREELTFQNLFSILCSYGDAVAAEYQEDSVIKKLTYSDYERMAMAGAGKLARMLEGVERNTFVALRYANNPLWPAAFWAIIMAGYRPLLLDAGTDDSQVMHVLRQAGSRTVVTDTALDIGGTTAISPNDFLSLDAAPAAYMPVFSDAIALCTSGTTSTPKVYVYTEKAVCDQVLLADYICRNNNEIMHSGNIKQLAFLPFHHIFGLIAVYMWYSFFGKTIVYIKNKTADVILSACKDHRVTHIYAVPLLWNNVAKGIMNKARIQGEKTYDKLLGACDLSIKIQRHFGKIGRKFVSRVFFKDVQQRLVGDSIQFLISGGGHIQPEALKVVNAIGYHLVSGFGMTETGIDSVELSNDIDRCLDASVGKPFQPMQYRIVCGTEGGRSGELQIRGEAIHSGRMVDGVYISRETADDGWFPSGDIAREVDGRYYIEGRLKDVIVGESGENIYPDELEDSFSELPYAEHICVVGIATKGVYDDTSLVVYMGEASGDAKKSSALIEEIRRINGLLPIYKKIKKAYLSLDPLSLANGIKVRRQKVKEAIERGHGRFEEIDIRSGVIKHTAAPQAEQRGGVYDVHELAGITEKVREIFADVLAIDPGSIGDTDHFVDDLGGDSLSSLGVFSRAEEFYNVIIPDTEYFTCANVEDLSRLLYRKIHHIEEAKEDNKIQVIRSVSSFEQSREYEDFAKRMLAMKESNIKDPYFVAHDSVLKDTSVVDGREVINLASYNYVGMSGNPRVAEAAKKAIDAYGTSASGSRLIAGEKTLYRELEKAIAGWKHTEDAIVLVGGHSTNVTFVGNFCNEHDLILYDALSHNSITQGCQLSASDTKAFPHNDFEALEHMLSAARDKYEKILIIVEGVYSMDGDIAPIPDFVTLKKKYNAFLMVDEAHSSCVIGRSGGGVDEYFGLLQNDIDIKMGTLSKGLGACGGYIAGKKSLVSYLRYTMPGFMFSVGISPPVAAAALEAVLIMREGNPKVAALQGNIAYFVEGAKTRGFNTCLAKETAIVPVMVGEDNDAYALSTMMLDRGVFVPPAVYPAVPKHQARLRFCLTSEHNCDQIDYALDTLDKICGEMGVKR